MCGIVGVVDFNGGTPDRELIGALTENISHRGPDSLAVEVGEGFGFGHARLSIIDIEGGAQPMYSHCGRYLITFNGEIFNYLELKKELEKDGVQFRSSSDTEVLIELFARFGEKSFSMLNGQFAFGICDLHEKQTYLVRDRMGEKPLFFTEVGGKLTFASELKVLSLYLSKIGASCKVSEEGLLDFLSLNYVPFSGTLLKGVRQLEPASFLILNSSGIKIKSYWDGKIPKIRCSPKEAREEFSQLLDSSLELRLRSDVPVGLFLSGGIDSSVLAVALAERKTPVTAFIADFNEDSFSEASAAFEVSGTLGLPYEVITIAPSVENLPELIESLVVHGDTPLADSSSLPVYLLSRGTSKHVKVVLSGDGGDELFGGYLTYQATRLAAVMPKSLRMALWRLTFLAHLLPISEKKVSFGEKLDRFLRNLYLEPGRAHFAWNGMFNASEKARLVHPDVATRVNKLDTFQHLAEEYGVDLSRPTRSSLQYADQHCYLPDNILTKVDRMTMAHGLEARPALLDYRMVEFARSLPPHINYGMFTGKNLLRSYLKDRAPWYDSSGSKKGFSIPIHHWLRTSLREFAGDTLHSSLLTDSGWYREAEVVRLWDLHQSKRRNLGFEIWGIMVSLLWWKNFIKN